MHLEKEGKVKEVGVGIVKWEWYDYVAATEWFLHGLRRA
jgi:hypothetical protein